MMSLLSYCIQKGFLLDKEIFDMLSQTDEGTAKSILELLNREGGQKIINKTSFFQGFSNIQKIIPTLEEDTKKNFERLFIRMGLQIEIVKEIRATPLQGEERSIPRDARFGVKIVSIDSTQSRKVEVQDFVKHLRTRFQEMRGFLQERSELTNLTSINKISENRGISIIAIISDKRITKNKNFIFEVEDLTGKINVLVNQNKPELYELAKELMPDDIVGIKASGSRGMLFANDIVYPDCGLLERKKSPVEESAIFLGDLHVGSEKFREDRFMKLVSWINGELEEKTDAEKVKYIILAGDLIDGVGIYPGQENELNLKTVEGQYDKVAEMLGKIRKDVSIIISPGNHDALRIMEPQPLLDERFASSLYALKNAYFTTNPCTVNLASSNKFPGFNFLIYHGYSFGFYVDNVTSLRMGKAFLNPGLFHPYFLKRRHLAPTHASTLYFPSEKDSLMIRQAPDVFVTAHVHRSSVGYYNNILNISTSGFQEKTPFQEKLGHMPEVGKVPLFNFKTRAVKILDFSGEEEKEE